MTEDPGTSGGTEPPRWSPPTPLCPKCFTEVARPFVHFCVSCRGPLTSHANTAPYEAALSRGWGIGEAIVAKRGDTMRLAGAWMILLPILASGALGVFFLTERRRISEGLLLVTFQAVFSAAMLVFGLWGLYRSTANHVTARRASALEAASARLGPGGGAPPPDVPAPPST